MDGESSFQDWLVKAKLWLATTRARGQAQGPMILQRLSGQPFNCFKHWSKDQSWLADEKGAHKLLEAMDQPEFFGEDKDEDLLGALAKITYHLRRERGEGHRTFFARWEECLRKIREHNVELPDKYQGFLMINALGLGDQEIKALMNFTRGSISTRDVKDWVRKHETKLQIKEVGVDKDKEKIKPKTSSINFVDTEDIEESEHEAEILQAALEDLQADDRSSYDPQDDGEEVYYEEHEAAEILATMLHQQQKKRTFTQSLKLKKAKELGRGFNKGFGKGKKGGPMGKQVIDQLKQVTRCGNCLKVGHWHRECTEPSRKGGKGVSNSSGAKETMFIEVEKDSDREAFFCGHLDLEPLGDNARTPEMKEAHALPLPTTGDLPGEADKPDGKAGSWDGQYGDREVLSPVGHEPRGEEFLMAEDSPSVVLFSDQMECESSQSARAYKVHEENLNMNFWDDENGWNFSEKDVFEIHHVSPENPKERRRSNQSSGFINEECCATIDTGCQRMAIGASTLGRLVQHLPQNLEVDMIKQEHKFRSVHGTSKTDQVASIPTSLGRKGCFLRPAVFSNEASKEAPFLISLPFLLHCRTILYLDPDRGLRLFFRKFGFGVDCHLGPTGALRVPLDHFLPDQLQTLQKAQQDMRSSSQNEFEVFKTCKIIGSEFDHSGPVTFDSSGRSHEEVTNQREVLEQLAEDDEQIALHHVPRQPVPHQGDHLEGNGDRRDGVRPRERDQQSGGTMEPCRGRGSKGKWFSTSGGDGQEQGFSHSHRADDPTNGTTSSMRSWRSMPGVGDKTTRVQLPEDVLEVPTSTQSTVLNVSVDRISTLLEGQSGGHLVPERDPDSKLTGVLVDHTDTGGSSAESINTVRDTIGRARESTGQLHPQQNYNPREQCLCEKGDMHSLQQGDRENSPQESGEEKQFDFLHRPHQRQEGKDQDRDGGVGFRGVPGVLGVPAVEEGQGEGQTKSSTWPMSEPFPADSEKDVKNGNRRQRRTLAQIQKKSCAAICKMENMVQEIMSLLGAKNSEETAVDDLRSRCKEKKSLESLTKMTKRSEKDLRTVAEVYNPGKFVGRAPKHDLLPGEAFDLELGDDLLKADVQQMVVDYLKTIKPGLVVASPPCTLFSILQNLNMWRLRDPRKLKEYLHELCKAKKLLKFAVEVINLVRSYKGTFLFEHPLSSKAWQEHYMQKLLMEPDVFLAKGDQCRFELKDSQGNYLKKRTGWISNNQFIFEELNQDCDGQHVHAPIVGSIGGERRSLQAQRYPPMLVDAILRAYKKSMEEPVEIMWSNMEYVEKQMQRGHRMLQLLKEEDSTEILAVNECLRELLEKHEVDQGDELMVFATEEEGRQELHPEPRDGDEPGHPELHQPPQELHPEPRDGDEPGHPELHQPPQEEHEQPQHLPEEPGQPGRLLPRERPFSTEQLVKRAHEGLGHPNNEKLARILRGAGANDNAIKLAKGLRCDVCQRHQQVRPPRAAAPPKELPVNHTIGVDTVWLPTHRGKQKMALNVVCWSSRFQMITPLANHTPAEARRAYLQWAKFFGPPQRLYTDLGKEFRAAFQEGAEFDSTYIEPGALEMPTQRSITERAGKTFKAIFEKALDSHVCQDESEWRDLVDVTAMTVNRLVNKSGFSPVQRVRGYSPRIPGSELLGGHHDQAIRSWASRGDLQVQRAQSMRLAAAKAFHEADCQQAIKNSLHAGRRSIDDFEVGNTVYFWRKAQGGKIEKNSARHWRGPAKVILTSPHSAIWISFRGHVVKAAPEHLRLASSEEHSSLSAWMDDLSSLRHVLEKEPTAGYIDLNKENGDELPEGEDEDEPKVVPKFRLGEKTPSKQVIPREETDYWQQRGDGLLRRVHVEPRQEDFLPAETGCPVPLQRLDDWRRTMRIYANSGKEEVDEDDWRNDPGKRQEATWKGYTEFKVFEESTSSSLPTRERPEEEENIKMESIGGTKRGMEEEENPETKEKRSRIQNNNNDGDDQHREEPRGTLRQRPEEGENEGKEQPGAPSKRTRIEWNEIFYQGALTAMAMKQKKEIKYKDLVGIVREKFDTTIMKEINNNLNTGAYEVLSPEESEEVRRREDVNILQSRYVFVEKMIEADEIEDAKAAGTLIKEELNLGYKAKARHVMKGFSEPDSEWLDAATPQVAPETVMLILQMLSSLGWTPGYLDFTQAFHSGDQINRLLFAELPPEGVPGLQQRQLLKLKKHCYGLLDGPYQWFQHLKRILLQLDYEQSIADPCLFMLFNKEKQREDGSRELLGLIGVATDDLFHGGRPEHWEKMEWIRSHYKLGKFAKGGGRFVGKEIEEMGNHVYKVHQQQFVKDKVKHIDLPKIRKAQKFDTCSPTEITALRGLLGTLSWLAKETRPDLQGRVSLLQQTMPHPMVQHILEANSLAKEAQKEMEAGIIIRPIPIQRLRIGVASDASWGNSPGGFLEAAGQDYWEEQEEVWIRHHLMPRRTIFHPGAAPGGPSLHQISSRRTTQRTNEEELLEDTWNKKADFKAIGEDQWLGATIFYKKKPGEENVVINENYMQAARVNSQGGHLCFAYDSNLETLEEPQQISILSWKSYKLKRCTVNTLSAEAQAMIQGVGGVHWMRLLLMEMKGHKMNLCGWEDQIGCIPYVAVTDSKSLYDTLTKSTNVAAQVHDKRTAIDLTILKSEMTKTRGQARWVPGTNMIVDCLTKKMCGSFLRFIMRLGLWTLYEKGSHCLLQWYKRG